LLHSCNTVFTQLLHNVSQLLHSCYTVFTLLLLCCYIVVSLLLRSF
jgi:hypothetical protein